MSPSLFPPASTIGMLVMLWVIDWDEPYNTMVWSSRDPPSTGIPLILSKRYANRAVQKVSILVWAIVPSMPFLPMGNANVLQSLMQTIQTFPHYGKTCVHWDYEKKMRSTTVFQT